MTRSMKITAKRLRTARIKKGFSSCREFALKHGFNPRTYQRHEIGANKIDFPTMVRYCAALDISILWLQTGDERYFKTSFSNQLLETEST